MNDLSLPAKKKPRCEHIDLTPIKIPQRSKLIGLEPLGMGSGDIESLWSYLHRIADAHAVAMITLFIEFFGNYKWEILGRVWTSPNMGAWKRLIQTINSPQYGPKIAHRLEELTGRKNLVDLTLSAAGATRGLTIRPRLGSAWCSKCLEEDTTPYERLLWATSGVTHCPVHGLELETICRHCGLKPQLFSTKSSIVRCSRCGHLKAGTHLGNSAPDLGMFEVWCSREARKFLHETLDGKMARAEDGVHLHNLSISVQKCGSGMTGLSRSLKLGGTTVRSWFVDGRCMPLGTALRWGWMSGVGLAPLFSVKLSNDSIIHRELSSKIIPREIPKREIPISGGDTLLYLTALKQSAGNPFVAPRKVALSAESGIHMQHAAFSHPAFRKLMKRLKEKERLFSKKERVWREINEVHNAAIRVVENGRNLSRRQVSAEMNKPGIFCGPLARAYFNWLKKRVEQNASEILQKKKIPMEIQVYWELPGKPRSRVLRHYMVK